jgi:integrase
MGTCRNRPPLGTVTCPRHSDRWTPGLGAKRLDEISSEDIQRLKHQLRDRAPKTVNNVLTVLSVLLKKAVEWSVIEHVPCTIRLVKAPKVSMGFYDFAQYEHLIEAAKRTGPDAHVVVLLGGEAGLRCGEMIGLEWDDVDSPNGTRSKSSALRRCRSASAGLPPHSRQ